MANYGSGFVSGAGAGAMAGSSLGPYGALAGGLLGGIAGLFGAYEQSQDEEDKRKILDKAKKEYNLTQDEVEQLMRDYYENPNNFLGTKEDVEAYRKAIADYNPMQFVYGYDEKTGKLKDISFGYDKSVDDFVNPYYDKIIGDTTKQIQHSAAGAGVGRGTGAANAIATGVAQKENELYNTALNQYNTDRSQSYTEWAGNIDKMQQRLNQLKSATDTKLNLQGNLAGDFLNTQKERVQDEIAQKQNRSSGNLNLANMGLMI